MSNNVLDLSSFTDEEILHEMNRRLGNITLPDLPKVPETTEITPYFIMQRMIEEGWKEDPRLGHTDERIKKMWDYVGFPTLTDDDSYCAATVNACLKLAGYEMSEKVPSARSFETYGRGISLSFATKGDIVVFKNTSSEWQGHVGFYTSQLPDDGIVLSGGNQGNKMSDSRYSLNSEYFKLSQVRRITDMNRVGNVDFKTLEEWKLI